MIISVIVAVAENLAIGKDNHLLWHLSGDMKHFKALTTGHTVVMGRNTYLSINKPLPNRRNIILSRTLAKDSVPGCEVVSDFEAIKNDPSLQDEEIFIMGGGEVYRHLMPMADRLYLTRVHTTLEADTFFPNIDESVWCKISSEQFPADEKNDFDFDFINYLRKKN